MLQPQINCLALHLLLAGPEHGRLDSRSLDPEKDRTSQPATLILLTVVVKLLRDCGQRSSAWLLADHDFGSSWWRWGRVALRQGAHSCQRLSDWYLNASLRLCRRVTHPCSTPKPSWPASMALLVPA